MCIRDSHWSPYLTNRLEWRYVKLSLRVAVDVCSSDVALLYNDKAVLENHHLSASFRLLKEDDYNILSTLKAEEYRFATAITLPLSV